MPTHHFQLSYHFVHQHGVPRRFIRRPHRVLRHFSDLSIGETTGKGEAEKKFFVISSKKKKRGRGVGVRGLSRMGPQSKPTHTKGLSITVSLDDTFGERYGPMFFLVHVGAKRNRGRDPLLRSPHNNKKTSSPDWETLGSPHHPKVQGTPKKGFQAGRAFVSGELWLLKIPPS